MFFIPCFFWIGYRPQFATDFDVSWLTRFGLAQGCAFWVSEVLKFSVRGSQLPKSGTVGKFQPKIPYCVYLSTACTFGKSYRNSVRMHLFDFNSPKRWCKIYTGRIYSFGDITWFATPYFADRSCHQSHESSTSHLSHSSWLINCFWHYRSFYSSSASFILVWHFFHCTLVNKIKSTY